jgi:hypothetical protein
MASSLTDVEVAPATRRCASLCALGAGCQAFCDAPVVGLAMERARRKRLGAYLKSKICVQWLVMSTTA